MNISKESFLGSFPSPHRHSWSQTQKAQPRAGGLESSVYTKSHPKAVKEEMLGWGGEQGKQNWSEPNCSHWLDFRTLVFWEPGREMEIMRRNLKGWYFLAGSPYMEQSKTAVTLWELVFPAATGTADFWVEEFVYTLTHPDSSVD